MSSSWKATAHVLPATVLVLLPALALSVSLLAAEPQSASGLGVSVAFTSMKHNTSVFMCTGEVKDLASGTVLSAPRIQVQKGATAKTSSGEKASAGMPGWQVDLEVSIDPAGTKAGYTVTYSRAGQVVAIQSSSLSLQ
jgi:hypothetical protein